MPDRAPTAPAPAILSPIGDCEPRLGRSSRRTPAEYDLVHRMLTAANAGADLRVRKVRRVKAAIREQAYENDLKLEVALQRLQDRVREEGWLLAQLRNPTTEGRAAGSS